MVKSFHVDLHLFMRTFSACLYSSLVNSHVLLLSANNVVPILFSFARTMEVESSNKNKPQNNNSQIIPLLILICLLTLIVLVFLYSSLYTLTLTDAIYELIRNIIPGFIGALVAYLVVYFLFVKRGISVNLDQQLETIKGIREDLDISSNNSSIMRGLIAKMKVLKHPFRSDLKLYTFLGLQNESDSNILQDFIMEGTNLNAVQFLWADATAGNHIYANVDTRDHFLQISFNNYSSAGSNIAIRLKSEKAHLKSQKMRYITFDIRIPEGNEKIAICCRIVNGWLQHWHYSNKEDCFRTAVLGKYCTTFDNKTKLSEWKPLSIDLEEPSNWHIFKSDGNYLYGPEEVDFGIITSFIIEVGVVDECSASSLFPRPGKGQGTFHIKHIRFTESQFNLF
jgi:hypothetical protein